MKITVLIALAVASATALAEQPSAALIAKARAAISKNLLDPYSARMENLRVVKAKDGTTVLCGTINAKNAFGAYAGAKRFFYLAQKTDPFGAKEGDSLDMLIPTLCP